MSKKSGHIIRNIIIILLIAAAAGYLYLTHNLNPNLSSDASKYNVSSEALEVAKSHRIVNVMIFGIDARADVEGERSDSMMIATIDAEHKSIKITSLMRDTYVNIPGYGYDKLNAAYSYGGAELALQTINENFDLAITDYVTVDFNCLVEIVNAVGGVTVNITSEDELYWLNQYLNDVNDKVGTSSPQLTSTGEQTLDGSQALAYCRIRYVGNGDFDRTQRQRTVFEQVVSKASDLSIFKQIQLVNDVMPYVKTSLTNSEIHKLVFNAFLIRKNEIQQLQVPIDTNVATGTLRGVSYVFPVTLTDNIKALYNFIYQIDYNPSQTAQDISSEIESVWY